MSKKIDNYKRELIAKFGENYANLIIKTAKAIISDRKPREDPSYQMGLAYCSILSKQGSLASANMPLTLGYEDFKELESYQVSYSTMSGQLYFTL